MKYYILFFLLSFSFLEGMNFSKKNFAISKSNFFISSKTILSNKKLWEKFKN
jgi:hypothetical protein